MQEAKLKKSKMYEGDYEYLSTADSILYERALKDAPDNAWASTVVRLLEQKADASRASHCMSRY